MNLASDKQIKFINSMRQVFSDYDELVGGEHQVPSATETWEMTKAQAGAYISKSKEEFTKCWTTLLDSREQ